MRVASFRVGAVCVAMVMSVMSGVAGAEPATPVATPTPGAILAELLRFRETGRVLYLAAHPDDENTRLIAYLANGRHYATAYLSHTRGDGGQNLIGPELGDELGLIRTHELILARAIDGGRQYFSRANDFGFSKSAEETLRVWDRRQVLADTVRVIRQFRPHVIVARFSPVREARMGIIPRRRNWPSRRLIWPAMPRRWPTRWATRHLGSPPGWCGTPGVPGDCPKPRPIPRCW
jgi:hypothetical protein